MVGLLQYLCGGVTLRPRLHPHPGRGGSRPRVAYFMNLFPNLTETFVYREVDSLRVRGFDVMTFSIRRPRMEDVSAEAHKYFADTYYILPVSLWSLLRTHVAVLLQQPIRYLRAFTGSVGGTHECWRDRARSLAHFAEAITVIPVVRRAGIRHLHAHFAVGSATCAWVVSRCLDLPFSITAHAYDIWCDRLLLPEKMKAADFVVTCTEYNADHLLVAYPEAAAVVSVVHHGVDLERFSAVRHGGRPVPLILAVGRLCEQKGFGTLLAACASLLQQGEQFECDIVGDGPLGDALRARASELALGAHVRFLGRALQEEMAQHYARADVFVLPCTRASDNDRDGIPNTIIEAMASGLPVVSTRFSGIPEAVVDGATGLLVPRDDPTALAQAMRCLLRDPRLRERFGAAGRRRAEAEFSLAAAAERLAQQFGASLAIARPPADTSAEPVAEVVSL